MKQKIANKSNQRGHFTATLDAKGKHMTTHRAVAINKLVATLEAYEIDLNQYNADLEPQGVYDIDLSGKLDALLCYCKALGWPELSSVLIELLPLRIN